MSKAIRTGKRTLAGVAAGALGLALIPFVGVTTAQAGTTTFTTTASPVRVTLTGTTLDTVPWAQLAWADDTTLTTDDSVTITLTSAPSPVAILGVDDHTDIGNATVFSSGFTSARANVSLGETDDSFVAVNGSPATGGALAIAASVPGTYTGTIRLESITTPADVRTSTFTFTTRGAVASMELTPAAASSNISGVTPLTVTLKDSGGNVTQPLAVDSVTMATVPASGGGTATAVTTTGSGTTSLFDGVAVSPYIAPATFGAYQVTATPGGTLPTAGVTTQTATISVSGAIDDTALTGLAVAVPTNAINNLALATTASVPSGTSTVTVAVTGGAGSANGTIRLAAFSASGGTINGATPGANLGAAVTFVNVDLDADAKGTATFTLAGNQLNASSAFSIQQVEVDNTTGVGNALVVTQTIGAVGAATILISPSGSIVQPLGTTTSVVVTVADQFAQPVSGATVRALRGGSTLLSSAVTDANGQATVTVEPLATVTTGQSENYKFSAQPVGVGTAVTATADLTVQYTTSGAVTSMSVTVAGGATTPILNTSTSIATLPYIQTPFGGYVDTTASGVYTVATATGTAGGNFVQFNAVPAPANTVTVTVPAGVKASTTLPSGTNTLWSAGAQTVTAASNQAVYVWATTTGEHDVTFTSGSITTTTKIKVAAPAESAYNIALTPTSQNVVKGGIGSATLTVTDVFGNPVQTSTGSSLTDDTGVVALVATGELLLAGFNTNLVAATGVDGTVRVAFIAGNASGEGSITATPLNATSASKTPAWRPAYIPPVGASAPALTSVAEVKVGSGPDTTSIVIEGSRANRTIIVDGSTSGIAAGTTVRPWIKFPGETEYTQGAASRQIVAVGDLGAGEFQWQRQTSKKIYVYFRTEDGTNQSLRVIIPGR